MTTPLRRTAVTGMSAVLLLGALTGVSAAGAPASPATSPIPATATGTPGNGCGNPLLSTDPAGWSTAPGDTGSRVATGAHIVADHEFAVRPAAGRTLVQGPARTSSGGGLWDLTFDVRAEATVNSRVEATWFDGGGAILGRARGQWIAVEGGSRYTRVGDRFLAPDRAARAEIAVAVDQPTARGFALTMCAYRPVEAPVVPVVARPVIDPTPVEPTPPVLHTPPVEPAPPVDPLPTPPPVETTPPVDPAPPVDPTPVDPEPGVPAVPLTAAERYGWGTPLPASDEFDYTGAPDPARWVQAGECWPGHTGNGRRCASRTTVDDGVLVQTGLANGDTGWLASTHGTRYGRWEVRIRTVQTGDGAVPYHPVLIVWPDSEDWPADGEYDFLENSSPGEQCAEAFLHYPHPDLPVQQEFARETDCGAPLSEWHTVAFEWTPEHVRGFVDGEQFFSFSGGEGPGRRAAIQAMPSGHLTIQLDDYDDAGRGLAPARTEVDWVRIYPS